MEIWKKHTMENIPEIFKGNFEIDIGTPMMLWIELNFLFLEAAKEGNDNLVKRIFDEADYYFNYEKNPNGDIYSTAVALAFVEHLLDEEVKIPYVVKYFSKNDFIKCKDLLIYHNSEKKYQKVLSMYKKSDKK